MTRSERPRGGPERRAPPPRGSAGARRRAALAPTSGSTRAARRGTGGRGRSTSWLGRRLYAPNSRSCASVVSRTSAPSRWARYQSTVAFQPGGEVPARRPVQPRARQRGVELEPVRLVRVRAGVDLPAQRRRPTARRGARRSSAPAARRSSAGPKFQPCATRAVLPRALGEAQVAAQRVEHVLPRADRVGVADADRRRRPARARKTSGSRRSSPQSPPPMTLPARALATAGASPAPKNERAVGGGHQLGAALGARVGVVAAHRLVLAVAPHPLAVLVALVRA